MDDVLIIQALLRTFHMYLGSLDSDCGSGTIGAIKRFQYNFMKWPDGLVQAPPIHCPTFARLTRQLPVRIVQCTTTALGTIPGYSFPFDFIPKPTWHTGEPAFGSRRAGGNRKHAGCDLIAPQGTSVYAVADGVVARGPYDFKVVGDPKQVQALDIRHGDLLVRYCEIKPASFTGTIKKGQKLAEVGLIKFPKSEREMLHIEIYTDPESPAPVRDDYNAPFYRRCDLKDPTPYLDVWAKNLPQSTKKKN